MLMTALGVLRRVHAEFFARRAARLALAAKLAKDAAALASAAPPPAAPDDLEDDGLGADDDDDVGRCRLTLSNPS
jgi:hypothetical protein